MCLMRTNEFEISTLLITELNFSYDVTNGFHA